MVPTSKWCPSCSSHLETCWCLHGAMSLSFSDITGSVNMPFWLVPQIVQEEFKPTVDWCWSSVCDAVPTLIHSWLLDLCCVSTCLTGWMNSSSKTSHIWLRTWKQSNSIVVIVGYYRSTASRPMSLFSKTWILPQKSPPSQSTALWIKAKQ